MIASAPAIDGFGRARAVRLRTARLVLRAPEGRDLDELVRLADDRAVAAMLSRMPHPYGEAEGRAFIDVIAPAAEGLVLALTLAVDGRFIGCASVEGNGETKELGYWLGRPWWGQGFATEAAQALVDHAFTDMGVFGLAAWRRTANEASGRVLHKCGFQHVGRGMKDTLLSGRVAMEHFRLEHSVWSGLRSWGK